MYVEDGDEVTITIKGKVGYGSAKFKLTLPRQQVFPHDLAPLCYSVEQSIGGSYSAECTLQNPEIRVEYRSKHKNGVHIDLADGSYWMRRPDGWHKMSIEGYPRPSGLFPSVPKRPQRLKEDK